MIQKFFPTFILLEGDMFLPNLNCNAFQAVWNRNFARWDVQQSVQPAQRILFLHETMEVWCHPPSTEISCPGQANTTTAARVSAWNAGTAIRGRICVSKRSIAVEPWKWSASEPSQMSLCLWWPPKDAIGGFHELLIYLILRRFARILAATVPWTEEFFYGRRSWNALDV